MPGKNNGTMKAVGRSKRNSFARDTKYSGGGHGQTGQHGTGRVDIDYDETRNKRSVWTVATASFKGAYFSSLPPDLIRQCPSGNAGRPAINHLRAEPRVRSSSPPAPGYSLDRRRCTDGFPAGSIASSVTGNHMKPPPLLLPAPSRHAPVHAIRCM